MNYPDSEEDLEDYRTENVVNKLITLVHACSDRTFHRDVLQRLSIVFVEEVLLIKSQAQILVFGFSRVVVSEQKRIEVLLRIPVFALTPYLVFDSLGAVAFVGRLEAFHVQERVRVQLSKAFRSDWLYVYKRFGVSRKRVGFMQRNLDV